MYNSDLEIHNCLGYPAVAAISGLQQGMKEKFICFIIINPCQCTQSGELL